ncbi:MAG TPA: hypothetical protein VKB86_06015 [Pyrinomonadaceae bacterium]|nr:hypothetical protein [Pyrinomonadaceae bacterium]
MMSEETDATRSGKQAHPWDKARRRLLKRSNTLSRLLKEGGQRSDEFETLDRGVNYFVLQLERFGVRTEWSCEGHPAGFYITFHATYEQALRIKSHGYFTVEIEGLHYWSMRFNRRHNSTRERNFSLRLAAAAWERAFGPLVQEMTGGLRS